MALTEGEETPKNDISSSDTKALLDLVKSMQGEIKTLKSQQLNPAAGIKPEDIVKLMAQFSAESSRVKEKDYRSGIQEEDIPLEDFDEKGVTFCAPFLGYVIADDRRKGFRVLLPYNKETILFYYQGETRRFSSGKEEVLSVFSTYTSQSKKEQEWLRNHTFFNTMFYESTQGAKSFDIIKAQKLSKLMTMISHFELPQLIARCKEYSIPINVDKEIMRPMLAMEMADRELKSEQNSVQKRLLEIEKEKELLMIKK